jgi:hypothetical protein
MSDDHLLLPPPELSTFDQFSALIVTYHVGSQSSFWKELREDFAELMRRLLEIQRGGRQRNPLLIAEDERLKDVLPKRNLAGKATQTAKLSRDTLERA